MPFLGEGVPAWLESQIWEWIVDRLSRGAAGNRLVDTSKLTRLENDLSPSLPDPVRGSVAQLRKSLNVDPHLYLSAVEHCLKYNCGSEAPVVALKKLLEDGRSLWSPEHTDSGWVLARALPPETATVLANTAVERPTVAHLLSKAAASVSRRVGDPSSAYYNAVRAVEAALQPIISPNDRQATLGKMIAELRERDGAFVFILEPRDKQSVARVRGLLELLWTSHHDRHGNGTDFEPATPGEARAAFGIAILIVDWVNEGLIKRAKIAD